jgi:hypothetical protein
MVFGFKDHFHYSGFFEFLDPFVCHWIGIFSSILYSYNPIAKEVNQMKKTLARYASNILGTSAQVFATILKPAVYSPEIPKELRK